MYNTAFWATFFSTKNLFLFWMVLGICIVHALVRMSAGWLRLRSLCDDAAHVERRKTALKDLRSGRRSFITATLCYSAGVLVAIYFSLSWVFVGILLYFLCCGVGCYLAGVLSGIPYILLVGYRRLRENASSVKKF